MPLTPLVHEGAHAQSVDREVEYLLGHAMDEAIERAITHRLTSADPADVDYGLRTIEINLPNKMRALERYNAIGRSGAGGGPAQGELVPLTALSDTRIKRPGDVPGAVLKRAQMALGITEPLPVLREPLTSRDPRVAVLRRLQQLLEHEEGLGGPPTNVGPIRPGETLDEVARFDRSCVVRATAEARARLQR